MRCLAVVNFERQSKNSRLLCARARRMKVDFCIVAMPRIMPLVNHTSHYRFYQIRLEVLGTPILGFQRPATHETVIHSSCPVLAGITQ